SQHTNIKSARRDFRPVGNPYWSRSFRGKRIIYDEEDELQKNDSVFSQSRTKQYQTRDRSQGLFQISQFI
uniref:Uncharacterized protein n=1 Tax=Solanum lycopersicum TaxID=4081 RepID=A0A3Q7FLE9_SOLLC